MGTVDGLGTRMGTVDGLGTRMGTVEDVQSLDDEREGLTLLEMSPVEPVLTVVMPDHHNLMNIMGTELLPDIAPGAVPEEVDPSLLQQTLTEEDEKRFASPKKRTPRRPRMKRETTYNRETPCKREREAPCDTGGQSLLACAVCSKNFVSISRLQSHEKTHTKSRPFSCIDCGKTFTVRYSLICHTRVHTRERPYLCGTCGARFSQASSLKTHQIYKHTKDFPYACKVCSRGFISPGQRHEHLLRTHAKEGTTKSDRQRKEGRKSRKKQPNAASQIVPKTEEDLMKTEEDLMKTEEDQLTLNGSNDQEVQTALTLPPIY